MNEPHTIHEVLNLFIITAEKWMETASQKCKTFNFVIKMCKEVSFQTRNRFGHIVI